MPTRIEEIIFEAYRRTERSRGTRLVEKSEVSAGSIGIEDQAIVRSVSSTIKANEGQARVGECVVG
jgi:hypothetical protein